MKNKVFFLGHNKMGTTSIHRALEAAGKNTCHTYRWGCFSQLNSPSPYFDDYQYFTDGNCQNYHHLKLWFPDAKFILLERDSLNWAKSIFSYQKNAEFRNMSGELYYRILTWIIINPIALFVCVRNMIIYKKRVLRYFEGDSNFLRLNIEKEGDDGWEKLNQFLDIELAPTHSNKQDLPLKRNWIDSIVTYAEKNANRYEPTQIVTSNYNSLRFNIFRWCHKTLALNFNENKRLTKRVIQSYEVAKESPMAGLKKLIGHIVGFIKIGIALALRIIINPFKLIIPYLV